MSDVGRAVMIVIPSMTLRFFRVILWVLSFGSFSTKLFVPEIITKFMNMIIRMVAVVFMRLLSLFC